MKNLLLGRNKVTQLRRRRRTDSGASGLGSLRLSAFTVLWPPQPLLSPGLNPTLAFFCRLILTLSLSGSEHRSRFYCCDWRLHEPHSPKCLMNLAVAAVACFLPMNALFLMNSKKAMSSQGAKNTQCVCCKSQDSSVTISFLLYFCWKITS